MFSHRPFALALAVLLLVFGLVATLACADIPTAAVTAILLILTLVGVTLLCVSTVNLLRKTASHARKTRLLALLLGVTLALLGLLRSTTSLLDYRAARQYEGKTAVATMTIRATETTSSGYARYRVLLEELVLDGETVTVQLTAALVQEQPGEYRYGDRLTGEVCLLPVAEVYPDTAYALSDGILLALEPIEDAPLQASAPADTTSCFGQILRFSQNCRAFLSYALRASVGGNAGRLAAAMLLGDRDALTEDVLRDFRRSGLSHLLAVSGLHLTVLVGMLSLLLRALGCGKRTVAILSIPLTLILLVLTGCSLSGCRASVMLICFALARCFYRKGDGLTMLFAAPAVILLVFPYAVYSVGLWMSFVSVLSLLVFSPILEAALPSKSRRKGAVRYLLKALRALLSAAGVSLVASLAVFPLLYLTGMKFSLAGTVTSLLTVPLTPLLLALSALALLLRPIAVFGELLAKITFWVAEWLLFVAKSAANLRFVSLSTAYMVFRVAVTILVLPTLVLLVALPILQGGRKKGRCGLCLLIAPTLAILLSVAGVPIENAAFLRRDGVPLAYGAVAAGEMMVYRCTDGSGVLFDLSSGRYAAYREGEQLGKELCISEWSAVVLTHYHTAQISSLLRFCRSHVVRTVYLPEAQTPAEEERLHTVTERLRTLGTPYLQYRRGEDVAFSDGAQFFLSHAVYLDRSVQPTFFLSVSDGAGEVGYLSSSVYESGLIYTLRERIARCGDLIFGLGGPIPKQARLVETEDFSAVSILISGDENVRLLKAAENAVNRHGEAVRVSYAENRRFYRRMRAELQ